MNRLAHETSPYLRQHADNPVDWYAWGPEAFAEAERSGRPVLLSVGYSACHWCHVMAHESFEDPDTAAVMNRLFVNIKVDREERPDVDAIYMEATQAMTGRGGWPMTVFMDAEGAPFYCGTYFPAQRRHGQPGFVELCTAIDDAWHHRRSELTEQSSRLVDHIRQQPAFSVDADHIEVEQLDVAESKLIALFDSLWGGFGGAPKFPQSMSIDLLLRQARRTGSARALEAARHSLDAMAAGGIYDHLGGGFARYSTDEQWLIPHFEKMLYDNALLLRPYLHAWQITGHDAYLQVLSETIGYVRRDLGSEAGGFFSAEDADSLDAQGHSEEGAFYVWSIDEIEAVLGDAADEFIEFYGVTRSGNFESGNVLFRPIGEATRPPSIDAARAMLLEHRNRRSRPGLDDKVLTEWNGLMIASLAEAAAATGNTAWRDAAVAASEFLCRELRDANGRWHRSWQAEGGARHLAYAHDYAALVDAFTRVYETTGVLRWLAEAQATAASLIDLFWDVDDGGFFTTGHDAEALVARPKDLMDNATPSANSTAASALLRLAPLLSADDPDTARFADVGIKVLAILGAVAAENPLAFANLLLAVELETEGVTEIVIAGDRPDLVEAVQRGWRPTAVLAWGERGEGSLWHERTDGLAYVCRDQACRQPADSVDELLGQLADPGLEPTAAGRL